MSVTTSRLAAVALVLATALGCTGCGHRPVHETQISRHYHHGRLGYERHTATRHRH